MLHVSPIPLIFVLLTSFFGIQEEPPKSQVIPVNLLLVGGGGTTDAIRAHALAQLGGAKKTKLLVIPQASERKEAGREIAKMWGKDGVKNIKIMDVRKTARSKKQIEEANFIWMGGGSQSRLMEALKEGKLIGAIKKRAKEGVLIGGTSAGTAVMTKIMIAQGRGRSIDREAVELGFGLGLLKGTIVDQHFLARARFNRLVSAVLEHPEKLGIGIDEKTAIFVHGQKFEVVGNSGVVVVDGSQAISKDKNGPKGTWSGIQLSILRPGSRFDMTKRKILGP
ncbi:MAG: cyanophycinase [Planctomycetota bacterium]|jgi:cyanophycinase